MARDKSGASAWPVPTSLEGAKSRKRAIFKVDEAKVTSGDKVISVSGVAVSLESRVAAVAEAGRAVAALLLHEQEPVFGETWEQKGLNVAHLGPHLAKAEGAAPTAEEHMAAVEKALRSKPHIVVIEEACATGGTAWVQTFHQLLQSECLQGFRGGVVICAQEDTFAVRRVCEERWSIAGEDALRQESITGKQLDVLEDVLTTYRALRALEAESAGNGKRGGKGQRKSADDRQSGAKLEEITALVEEARALSEYCFEEEDFEKDWTLSLLTEATQEGGKSLRGFICYKTYTTQEGNPYIYIARLAVPRKFRKFGYARKLVQWLISEKARVPKSECSAITCSALNSVTAFYEKLGFVAGTAPAWKAEEEEDPEDPQTWMEIPNVSLV